jgi:progressive ankylosis protein
MTPIPRSHGAIFLFWAPLALQWLMMAVEGPFLAAVIARMGDPTPNLAAYGVAFAFAILVESPVIMLMSASTALVDDRVSYYRMRTFANVLSAGSTALLLLVLVPPVYDTLMSDMLGLPADVAQLVYGALWLLLPWPAAIGYRRFLHGVMIHFGRTRLIAYGTMLRLLGMATTALALYVYSSLPGALVGAAALSAGVVVEAIATRIMARGALRELLGPDGRGESALDEEETRHLVEGDAGLAAAVGDTPMPAPHAGGARGAQAGMARGTDAAAGTFTAAAGYRQIARFYYPLALTSFIGLSVHPMLTFFMGRSVAPLESLAVFPVVHALSFLFRSFGFSYQEAAIALLGRQCEHVGILSRFGLYIAVAASGGMALVAFTPLSDFWFGTVSGLPPELVAAARAPAQILFLFPAMAVLLALQQAVLVHGRATRPITLASAIEVVAIAILFVVFGWVLGFAGVNAAVIALLGGRACGNLYLMWPVGRVLARH